MNTKQLFKSTKKWLSSFRGREHSPVQIVVISLALPILVSLFLFIGNFRANLAAIGLWSSGIYKVATTTVFWVGETASDANAHIDNISSAWNETWQKSYGGYDDPHDRCGFFPCNFTPKQNPFYFALPYDDLVSQVGTRKENAHKVIPWYDEDNAVPYESVLENHWIKVAHDGHICYGQWKDVGPISTNDHEYVFGDFKTPKNNFGLQAGLDVSPALRDCLGFSGSAQTKWKFVDARDVPEGPWTVIISGDNTPDATI